MNQPTDEPTSAECPTTGLASPESPPAVPPAQMTDRELRDACRAYKTGSRTVEVKRELLAELERRWRI